jgi:thiamine pyrophosphate-dependent acetolactate synthase large subunit-like protein
VDFTVTRAMLDRRQCVRQVLADRGDLLVVGGLGAPTYDIAAAGDHPLNFYLWGAMGGAAMMGLGLALARPRLRVLVVTGDGEMLMGLGSLATIGVKQPRNLAILVLDNRRYGETGMQASHTEWGVDLAAIAQACRFPLARGIGGTGELDEACRLLRCGDGPVFVQAVVEPEAVPRVLPPRDGHEIRLRFAQALAKIPHQQ